MSQFSASSASHETLSLPAHSTSSGRPSQAPVHTIRVDQHSQHYSDYSAPFSEPTEYDNKAVIPAPISRPPSSSSLSSLSSSLSRNTSTRQIEAFGNKFLNAITEGVKTPPAVNALSRTKTLHQRARSLASFVSALTPASVEAQKGTSTVSSHKTRNSVGPLFGANYNRRHSVDLIEEEQDEGVNYSNPIMEYHSTLTGGNRPSRTPNHTARPSVSNRQSTSRKFSWFGSIKQQPAPTETQSDPATSDLLQPATSLLFTHRSLDPQDPAASFTDLMKTAETLITRLQTAYRQQEIDLKTARQEREAAVEESEEADTRACHLKLQLEEMAKKANEQEIALKSMTEELAAEKLRRTEDNQRLETLQRRVVDQDDATPKRASCRDSTRSTVSTNSMSSMASDSGFESDSYTETDATADSIASRPMTPVYEQQRWDMPTKDLKRPGSTASSMQDRSCNVDIGVWRYMREEKGRLEQRVRELEGVLDGCLDLVS